MAKIRSIPLNPEEGTTVMMKTSNVLKDTPEDKKVIRTPEKAKIPAYSQLTPSKIAELRKMPDDLRAMSELVKESLGEDAEASCKLLADSANLFTVLLDSIVELKGKVPCPACNGLKHRNIVTRDGGNRNDTCTVCRGTGRLFYD